MNPLRLHRQKGFSLIEILIALLILGGGLLGLARLQMGMLGGAAESVLHDNAIRLAEDKLESLRFGLADGHEPFAGHDELEVDGVRLERSWSGSIDNNGLVRTEVAVRWQMPASSEVKTLTLPALMIRPDLVAQAWLIQAGQPSRESLP
jgi:prepilin-type N-terminal cleavage/methylation domain-containing protein